MAVPFLFTNSVSGRIICIRQKGLEYWLLNIDPGQTQSWAQLTQRDKTKQCPVNSVGSVAVVWYLIRLKEIWALAVVCWYNNLRFMTLVIRWHGSMAWLLDFLLSSCPLTCAKWVCNQLFPFQEWLVSGKCCKIRQ